MIDLEKMAEAHKRLFPKTTLESQVWKLEEELKELHSAIEFADIIKEKADVIIVCIGIYRFAPAVASYLLPTSLSELEEQEVNRKWQINLKRKWVWNGKTYHHEGNDE
ncbi:MAG: hypothetical protein IJS26_03835 [Alphaproteobacteria bacterium]|nr:hypothetical protein [Alphaproteobacteria bacterium]